MAPPEYYTDEAVERLLFCYPNNVDKLIDFENYMRDIASLCSRSRDIPPHVFQEARAAFLLRLEKNKGDPKLKPNTQKERQRKVTNKASLGYLIFDVVVFMSIVFGLLSLWGKHNNKEPIKKYFFGKEPAQAPLKMPQKDNDGPLGAPGNYECLPPIKSRLFREKDIVDVIDPSIGSPLQIPWEIKDILSNNDGSTSFHLQRHIAGRKSLLVLENVNAESIIKSEPFEPNTKAMCEFYLEILPCTVLRMTDLTMPGGGLYAISFERGGKVHTTYRPHWNIWRIPPGMSDDDPSLHSTNHPLAQDILRDKLQDIH